MAWILTWERARRLSAQTGQKIVERATETHQNLQQVRQSIDNVMQGAPVNLYKVRFIVVPSDPSQVPDGS